MAELNKGKPCYIVHAATQFVIVIGKLHTVLFPSRY